MTDPHAHEDIPAAVVRPRRFSTVWLIPAAALVFVAALLWTQTVRARGTTVTIRFADAGGLKPGSDLVHRGLAVGVVRDVRLTPDMSGVLVEAELARHAEALAVEGTQFWVVKPEVSLQRVSGLETLLGPRYIAVRPGPVDAARRDRFDGLRDPPSTEPPSDGSVRVTLRATRLGSLAPGGPIVFREVRVGTIRAVELASDATGVLIAADIEPRYAPLVRGNSRFWRAGGLGVDFSLFRGLSVQAESLNQLITSGIAFATPNRPGDPPAPAQLFDLADAPDKDWLEWAPAIDLLQSSLVP